MLCHRTKHGRKRTPRQLSDATWEMGDDAVPRNSMFDCSLYLAFQLRSCKLLCASTFCWPSFDVGRGEGAGWGELARKQERKSMHGMPTDGRGGGVIGPNKKHARLVKRAL